MQKQVIFLFLFLLTNGIFGQNSNLVLIQDLEDNYGAKISYHNTTGVPSFIRFNNEQWLNLEGTSVEEKSSNFLENYGVIFGIENPTGELILREIRSDVAEGKHLIFNQYYNDVLVFGSDFRLHFNKDDELTAVNGVFIPNLSIFSIPIISAETAAEIAIQTIQEQRENISQALYIQNSSLRVFKKGLVEAYIGDTHLVYEIEIRNDYEVREYLFIDAHKGEVIQQYKGMCDALSRKLYQTNTNTSNLIWEEGDPFPGSLSTSQQEMIEVTGQTYHFFNNTFGFDSYNGSGAVMLSVRNYMNGCPNAFWNGTFAAFCSGVDADDIVGHEWGHAYTEGTSDLIYAWQTGALNESYSDIWGETIDILNTVGTDTGDGNPRTACTNTQYRWQMGEDATSFGGSIRDMWNPTCDGDPGKVTDSQYWCSTGDGGGVHTNSGVNNHAYSLLVDGGIYNGRTIAGIGMVKAAHIFWSAQSNYLTRTSDFYAQADALEAACAALVGINLEGFSMASTPTGASGEIITIADCQQVADVNLAVEFRTTPNCGFTPMLAENGPAECTSGTLTDLFFDDFESGFGNWTVSQIPTNAGTWNPRQWELNSVLPKGRPGTAVFGPDPFVGNCAGDLDNGIIRMESDVITTSASISADILMSFYHYASMEANWDGGNIKYSINGGSWTLIPSSAFTFNSYNASLNTVGQGNDNPLAGQTAFTGADGGSVSGSWGQSLLDLSEIGMAPGDNIQFRFELGTDGCNGWDGWYIDDVRVYYCMAAALPVELNNFIVVPTEELIQLKWTTSSETDNLGFDILRSLRPSKEFEKIGYVKGFGNSTIQQFYEFKDADVLPNITYYYRLRQIDFDGTTQLSPIKAAKLERELDLEMTITPNPANDFVQLLIQNPNEKEIEVSLIDLNGRTILSQKVRTANGANFMTFDLIGIERGFYFVKLQNDKNQLVQKIILN